MVLSSDGEYVGTGERGVEKELDKVVQFERFGFVRNDSVSGDEVVAYFSTSEIMLKFTLSPAACTSCTRPRCSVPRRACTALSAYRVGAAPGRSHQTPQAGNILFLDALPRSY
jgi:hypothetical protein